MLDEQLQPWIMEINLSPSLSCDSPLDFKIKETLITDLFNMVGFQRYDRKVHKTAKPKKMPVGKDEVHNLPPPDTDVPNTDENVLNPDLESAIDNFSDDPTISDTDKALLKEISSIAD